MNETDYPDYPDNPYNPDEAFAWVDTFSRIFVLTALLLIFVLTVLEKRKNLCPDFLNGHIALVLPINFLESRSKRKAFVCAYALATLAVIESMDISIAQLMGPFGATPYGKLVGKLLIMSILSLVYFPLVSCIHVASVFSCILGLIYILMTLISNFGEVAQINSIPLLPLEEKIDKILLKILVVPAAATFLIYWFCKQLYKLLRFGTLKKKRVSSNEVKCIKNLLQTKRNRYLTEMTLISQKSKLKDFFRKHIYSSVPGFRYSLPILISCVVGFIMISKMAFKFIFSMSIMIASNKEENFAQAMKNQTLPNFAKIILSLVYKGDDLGPDTVNMFDFIIAQFTVLEVCTLLAVLFAYILNGFTICHELKSYRDNVLHLAGRKKQRSIMEIKPTNNVSLVLSAIQFMGYQVAYFFFGFAIQLLALLLVFLVIGELVLLPLRFATKGFFLWILSLVGPFLCVILITKVTQFLLVKFVFLEDKGKTMAITNRRGFYIMMYIVFFYNVLTGFMSCLMRIIKGSIMGLLLLPRLDRSVFPKTFENKDSGFKAYACLLHLEALQSDPILVCFINILNSTGKEFKKIDGEKLNSEATILTSKNNKAKRALIRWFVAYTLVRNPILVHQRKVYLLKERVKEEKEDNHIVTVV